MDYKSKIEKTRQLRASVDAFLRKLAGQGEHLEIASNNIDTAIHSFGVNIAKVFFYADSIRIKGSDSKMLQMYYAQLQRESIPCRYEYEYGGMYLGIEATYAQKALQSIILNVQNSKAGKQEKKTTACSMPAETVSAIAQPAVPVSELPPVTFAPQGPASETKAEAFDLQKEQASAMNAAPLKVHSALTGKVIKMLLCADLRLGAVSAEQLDRKQSHTWQAARNEKYANLIDKASQSNAAYIALWGQCFGQARVTESVIDTFFQAIRNEASIVVLAFVNAGEYKRISYRSDIPENLHLINVQAQDSYLDDRIALRVKNNAVELQLGDNDAMIVSRDTAGHYVLNGMPGNNVIPSFEPTGFEDAQDAQYGYEMMEWTEDKLGQFRVMCDSKYAFKAVELKLLPEDDEKEILRKINHLIRSVERDTFLRVTLTGRSAFGLTISSDALKGQMQSRIFFAKVYDNTVMDIDEESFETDISLRSEFVRLALQDGSLSESERSRLISLGWNALSGKEVSAE